MRNLKKLLAVVVAVTILLTAMVPAFAASYVYEDEAQTLYDLDLYAGTSTSSFVPDLGASLTRAQGAVLVLKMFNLLDEAYKVDAATVAETLAAFKDAKSIPTWADEAVAYAVTKGIISGRTNGNFDPSGKLKAKDFAMMVLKKLGYESAYATAADKLAEVGGLTIDNEKDLLRDDVVGMIYNTLDVSYADKSNTVIGALVAAKPALKDIAAAAGLIAANASKATVAATGAKILTVTFDAAVADTSKVTFSVKKGAVTVNVSKFTFADDKKSAKLELATKLTEGEYTVSVAGIAATAVTATTKVENEKVAKIEFTSGKAVLDATYDKVVTTSYKVFNQYAEDVTSSNTLTFTAGKGTPSVTTAGTLKLEATSAFTVDEKVAVSAIHASSNTFTSAVLTVVPKAAVSEVTISSLYNADSKVPTAGDTGSNYKLVVEAKDQYGNDVAYDKIAGDVIVTVSNTTVADVAGGANTPSFTQTSINGENKATLALAGTLTAGTSTVSIISKTTGKIAKFAVEVKEAAKVDVLTLSTPELAVAGEKVNIPFTAVDQFGAAITSASDLTAGMISLTAGSYPIAFKQDYVKNSAYLELDLTGATAATTVFITGVTKTNKVVTLQVSVVDPKKPVVINNTSDLTVNVAVGGTITLSENNLIAKDQYGRDITPDFGTTNGKYKYVIETSDSTKVSLTGTEITADDGSVTLTGLAKGTSTITATIKKNTSGTWADVDNSAITFEIKVVEKADIASYELADFAKLYQISGSTHDVGLTVNGLLANGAKVAIPASYYTVTINDDYVAYNSVDKTVYSVSGRAFGDATTVDVPVIVTVFGNNGPVVLNKNVTVCKATPAIDSVELTTSGIATKEADGVVSVAYTDARTGVAAIVVAAVKTVDQYGVEVTDSAADYSYIAATNLPDGRAANLSDIAAGDTFNVIAITKTGKTITFKVIVK